MSDVADILRAMASGAELGSKLPGGAGDVLDIAGDLLRFGAELADAGHDVRATIPILRSHLPVVAKARRSWDEALARKFGADDADTDPAPPPSAGIAHDPGDEDDG